MEIEIEVDATVLRRLANESPQLYKQAITRMGEAVESEAIDQITGGVLEKGSNRAIATGNLAASIGTRVGGEGEGTYAEVYAGTSYAIYVHEGTGIYGPSMRPLSKSKKAGLKGGMRARPFLWDAVKIVEPRFVQIIYDATGVWVGKVIK